MNCLLVPSLALDLTLLDRLDASIDYPIANRVILNNGELHALDAWQAAHPEWEVKDMGRNLGVAASWNLAPHIWPEEDRWLVVNEDIQFLPGRMEAICRVSDEQQGNHPILFMNTTQPFWGFVWTRAGVSDFGLFDENFWPAYYEDYEMRLRYNKVAVRHFYIFGDGCPVVHGKMRNGGKNYNAMIQGCGLLNREYFLKKWGIQDDHDCNEAFRTPYDDPGCLINTWRFFPEQRAAREAIWNTFWNLPNRSIYT